MKKTTSAGRIIRAVVFSLLALTLPLACRKESVDDKPAAAVAPPQLAQDMIGTWVHVGTPGHVREVPATGQRLKFRTGRHWNLTRADPDTGLVMEHFGGTYTLNGNEYVGSSRVDLQACKLEYSIVSPK